MRKMILIGLAAGGVALATLAGGPSPATANPTHANGQIAFARYDPSLDDTVFYTINPDGSQEQQVVPFALECPHWSPDGTRLASCGGPDGSATAIVDPDTGNYRELPMPQPGLLTYCYLWAPDAKRLACESFGESDPSLNGIYTIRISDGRDLRQMTSNPGGDDTPIAYSPNGKRLAFIRTDADGNSQGLFTVKTDGTASRQIAPAGVNCCGGDWSPQGNDIVFAQHDNADVRASIWVVHANGSGLREIHFDSPIPCGGAFADPNSRGCFDATWSPDAKQIAFIVNEPNGEGESLYTANIDGSNLTQLTHGDSESPDWGTHPLT